MKKQSIVAAIVAGVVTVGLSGVGVAYAATNPGSNHMSSLVDAVATKFNLNRSDVQSVFDSERAKIETTREQSVKDEIAALVTSKKLSQAQADALNTKRTELQAQREANRTADQNKTEAERDTLRQTRKTEIDAWLKQQGIDQQYGYLLAGGGHGHGGMHGKAQRGGALQN